MTKQAKPKKFLGAALAIGAIAASVASSVKANKDQKKAQKKADAEKLENEELTRAQLLNQRYGTDAALASDYNALYDTQGSYKNGGKANISSTGELIPITNTIFKAKGPSHAEGGIDLGNINIEGEEVVQFKKGGKARIFSKEPIANGASPAKIVAGNPNPKVADVMFKNQETGKAKLGYNDDGTRNGVYKAERRKAALGTSDWTSLGSAGASLATGIGNLVMASNMAGPSRINPILTSAPAVNTDISTASQQANIRRSRDRTSNLINDSTSSDAVRLARLQQNEIQSRDAINDIVTQEQNAELQLQNQRNEAVSNAQRSNAATINETNQRYADATYAHNVRRSQNMSGAVANIASTFSNVGKWYADSQNQTQYQNKQLSTILATDTNNSSISMIEAGSFDNYFSDPASVTSSIAAAEAQGNLALAQALRQRYRTVTGKEI